MEKMGVVKTIVTQNVDGLHQVAGSKHVVEMHGTGRTCYCLDCDFIAPSSEEIWGKTESPSTNVPRCPKCGGLLKLDVILFGEKLNRAIYNEALKASTETDFLLVIGTSLQVAPCNIIPFRAKHCGAQVAFINCTKTPLDEFADFIVRGDAQEYLPKIYKIIKRIRKQKRNSIKHAIKLSFSFAIVLMSMFVTFCNTTFHTNVKLPSFDDKSTDVPILDEYEPNLRRHSIPETEY
ncbi:Sir2 family transcriptional regulator [Entamoeba marina]